MEDVSKMNCANLICVYSGAILNIPVPAPMESWLKMVIPVNVCKILLLLLFIYFKDSKILHNTLCFDETLKSCYRKFDLKFI